MSKVKFIIEKVLGTLGINGKAALVLKIMALLCTGVAYLADSVLDDAKNERLMEKMITEKIQEMIEDGTLKVK